MAGELGVRSGVGTQWLEKAEMGNFWLFAGKKYVFLP